MSGDLPVPLKFMSSLPPTFVSPFLHFMSHMAPEHGADYAGRTNDLNLIHDELFASVRRLASLYQSGNYRVLEVRIASLPWMSDELEGVHPIYKLHRYIQLLYCLSLRKHDAAISEFLKVRGKCRRRDATGYATLLSQFESTVYLSEHRRKLVDCCFEMLDHFDAFFTGMAWERTNSAAKDIDQYRA